MNTYTTLRATTTNWTTEEGCKVVESTKHVDQILSADCAAVLLATGRRWLTPWCSVEWSYTPVEVEEA